MNTGIFDQKTAVGKRKKNAASKFVIISTKPTTQSATAVVNNLAFQQEPFCDEIKGISSEDMFSKIPPAPQYDPFDVLNPLYTPFPHQHAAKQSVISVSNTHSSFAPAAVSVGSSNIILHLRCRLSDLPPKQQMTLSSDESNIASSREELEIQSCFTSEDLTPKPYTAFVEPNFTSNINIPVSEAPSVDPHVVKIDKNQDLLVPDFKADMESAYKKIQKQKYVSHRNKIPETCEKCCFWCIHPFENEPFYIPTVETPTHIECYGNFCSPHCAVAFLEKERIGDSVRYERYALLNRIYSTETNCAIKPAPDTSRTLQKFLGVLTIEEYRTLFFHPCFIRTSAKPMIRNLPELYEETNSMLTEGYSVPKYGGTYKVKRASDKVHTPVADQISNFFGPAIQPGVQQ